jgi:hypothetical protein
MIFWSLSALIWFKNMKKMLLQMTSGFLQLEPTIYVFKFLHSIISFQSIVVLNDIRAVSVIFNMLFIFYTHKFITRIQSISKF